MVNSNRKGGAGERELVTEANIHLGEPHNTGFSRNTYNQRREAGHSDIRCDDPRFPFAIESKRAKSGSFKQKWMDQAVEAGKKSQKFPVVAYRFDRKQWQVVMRLGDLMKMYWGKDSEFNDLNADLVTVALPTFFKIADEIFSDVKRDLQRFAPKKCDECDGSGEVEKIIKDPSGFPYEVDLLVECPECEGAGAC